MKKMRSFIIVVEVAAIITISGCSTIRGDKSTQVSNVTSSPTSESYVVSRSVSVSPALRANAKPEAQLNDDERKELQSEIQRLITYCKPILTSFENSSRDDAIKAFYLSVLGLVSGAVIAPALTAANAQANASWIAAFSGIGGATNFASQAFKESGMSGTFAAQDRNRIITRIRDQLTKVLDGTLPANDRIVAIVGAKAECALYEISVPSVPSAPSAGGGS
jgi:hypothetical protein